MAVAAPLPLRLAPALLRRSSDDRLVAHVRAGSEAAFETLYDRHAGGILAFARHMLGSREEAEDVVQHTFAAAYRALMDDDRAVQVRAWLYAVARNRCLDLLRARRDAIALEGLEPATEGLSKQVQRRADLRALLGDLARLPDEQRAALVLAELGAHSHEEIGAILAVRREKVKALVFQARETLEASRRARDTDCRDIRRQLSVLRGGALRRTTLRRHLQECPGCRAFRAEVRVQRAAMAVLLPVVPSVGLKSAVLGTVLGGGGLSGGAGVGGDGGAAGDGGGLLGPAAVAGAGGIATAGLSAGTLSGGSMMAASGVQSVAAKVLVMATLAGGAGGGYLAVGKLGGDSGRTAPADRGAAARLVAPAPGPVGAEGLAASAGRVVDSAAAASKARPGAARSSARRGSGAEGSGRSGGTGSGGTGGVTAVTAMAPANGGGNAGGRKAGASGAKGTSGARARGRARRDAARANGRARRDVARDQGRARRAAARAEGRARRDAARTEARERRDASRAAARDRAPAPTPTPAAAPAPAQPAPAGVGDQQLDDERSAADQERDEARARGRAKRD